MILVAGATGKVGRELVAQLAERGVAVRAATRHPESAALLAGVDVVRADLSDPGSLAPHLEGVEAMFLLWPFTSPEAAADLAPIVVKTIAQHVGRIVYLSAQAAAKQPDSFWAEVERLIEASGATWTFLRPGALPATRSCGRIRSVPGTSSAGPTARRPGPSSTSVTSPPSPCGPSPKTGMPAPGTC
jgi:uncharacterized protein YbjT (DUF2867 family)